MATFVKFLNKNDINSFEEPPIFSSHERKNYFFIPKDINEILAQLRNPINKIGFILQFGYFKATNRFFNSSKYKSKDVDYLCKKLQLPKSKIVLSSYKETTFERHQGIILDKLGYFKFSINEKQLLFEEAKALLTIRMKPKIIFLALIDFLKLRKIQIPQFNVFSELITDVLKLYENEVLDVISSKLTVEQKNLIEELLKKEINNSDSKIHKYKLTLLRKSNQSSRPLKIKENIQDLVYIKKLFNELIPIIESLQLSPEVIRYYAFIVKKSEIFQLIRREPEKRYLLLIAFVIHHYYQLNDILIQVLLKSVQSAINTAIREQKENLFETRNVKVKKIENLANILRENVADLEKIKQIVYEKDVSPDKKIIELSNFFDNKIKSNESEIAKDLAILEDDSQKTLFNADYFHYLEIRSVKLQNRVSNIVKELVFDSQSSDKALIDSIDYYKKYDGTIKKDVPMQFLNDYQKTLMSDHEGKINVSLYKVLLFGKIADGIKSGALNLLYSFNYKAFDEYLITKETWDKQKEELLFKSGLDKFSKFKNLETKLRKTLNEQYRITNLNIEIKNNLYAEIKENGKLRVSTPKTEKAELINNISLFPNNKFISLFEVLFSVNNATNFSEYFEHWQLKYNKVRPNDKTFFAGIVGFGCNLGINKIARISKSINSKELQHTANWYFNIENLNMANDCIVDFMNKMPLSALFKNKNDQTHTSSDGQKFSIAVESLNANYSYKYFGKGKGVTVYSFIDESHKLFYSTVISSSTREASYVIDGLMHNDVIKSDIHSTDTHGYNELIFGVTHLLGISFAPRIKNFRDSILYGFDGIADYKKQNYNLIPSKIINTDIINEHWDDILRFIATIKLKHNTASQLFNRLSSYSKQHPLYRALKEFGKIVKSIFLLMYIDDLKLRQIIEKTLNKLESSNKFRKAVYHGNNQEFQQATKEDQLVVDGCSRLIQNSIICWNYLYLTEKLIDCESLEFKKVIMENIVNKSAIAWQHVNLIGEYDFSEESIKNSIKFDLDKIMDFNIEK